MVEICETPLQLAQYFSHSESLADMCRLNLATASETASTTLVFYLEFFALTIILEAAFYFAALRNRPLKTKLAATFIANLATHPAVCFLFPWICARFELSRATELTSAEIFAPLVESLLLIYIWKLPKLRAFGFMIAANLLSWWFGLILYSYIAPYMLT